jgi:hypothetical protein
MSLREYIKHGTDSMGIAVLGEDGVAVLGVAVAAGCIALSHFTQNYVWDGVGSVIVGGIISFFFFLFFFFLCFSLSLIFSFSPSFFLFLFTHHSLSFTFI